MSKHAGVPTVIYILFHKSRKKKKKSKQAKNIIAVQKFEGFRTFGGEIPPKR
jgi:hypothetical protein